MRAVGCAHDIYHDSGENRNVLIVSICLFIGLGFTLRSNTHRAVKVLGMREGPVLLHVAAGPKPVVGNERVNAEVKDCHVSLGSFTIISSV